MIDAAPASQGRRARRRAPADCGAVARAPPHLGPQPEQQVAQREAAAPRPSCAVPLPPPPPPTMPPRALLHRRRHRSLRAGRTMRHRPGRAGLLGRLRRRRRRLNFLFWRVPTERHAAAVAAEARWWLPQTTMLVADELPALRRHRASARRPPPADRQVGARARARASRAVLDRSRLPATRAAHRDRRSGRRGGGELGVRRVASCAETRERPAPRTDA